MRYGVLRLGGIGALNDDVGIVAVPRLVNDGDDLAGLEAHRAAAGVGDNALGVVGASDVILIDLVADTDLKVYLAAVLKPVVLDGNGVLGLCEAIGHVDGDVGRGILKVLS